MSSKVKINTSKKIVPMIYAYTTPEIARHDGWLKIGYTEQTVEERVKQQTHTADVEHEILWRGTAIYDDGSGDIFNDHDFHAYLRKLGVENDPKNEWFHISKEESRDNFYDFRSNSGIVAKSIEDIMPYTLRSEQDKAVSITKEYFETHENGEFLWNAKPRFGKTLSVYDLCKRMQLRTVLIVTNRPAIANSWYSDYTKFLGPESGYDFISETDSLKGKTYVLTRDQYNKKKDKQGFIEFVSLQDLKGSVHFGGQYDKLGEVAGLNWDMLVIDEAHEGVDTYKTDVAFDHIKRKHTLHLSGTPFKALANDKFPDEAIYNWTYADEQRSKKDWDYAKGDNPYGNLPRLNMFTYQMSEIIKDELSQGVEINGETEEYAFDLNEFFEVKGDKFVHESSVDKFLDVLTTQDKFPFSTPELRNELRHTFWFLNRVASAKALAKKLKEHPVFKDYEVILAAGDGKLDDEEETKKSFNKVVEAIEKYDKTITLSVGQLTTGVTIPEWTAVLMLSNIKSPSLYMQAAFRAQNPCLFHYGTEHFRKENAYVFDFDPARTLMIFEEFANDLNSDTSDGRGDAGKRKENVRELLNFFPVIGEDEEGHMVELDAEKVLSIPRKIRSVEVVRRGFMSDFLFQNISNVFHAPQEVIDIINNFTAVAEPKAKVDITPDKQSDLSLNEDGDVELSEGYVIGRSAEVFGDKIFSDIPQKLQSSIDDIYMGFKEDDKVDPLADLKKVFHEQAVKPLMDIAKNEYGKDLSASENKRLEKKIIDQADSIIGKAYGDFSIENKKLDLEREKLMETAKPHEIPAIEKAYAEKKQEVADNFKQALSSSADTFIQQSGNTIVETVETSKREQEKKGIEDSVRDHLRGFSRTIPSFLMAYGTEDVTLENFDTIIPDEVFKEVTSITLDQFRFLRDGGQYINKETGEQEMFKGHLFDPVVFNDSVKEFLRLKKKLANYFDESGKEDIFDYIPPQKTNQIFTPKRVVKQMVDMLETENPGCYDDPDKTFIDLYMKSGLYITEIVKRLYRSERMKRLFPNEEERLEHIFGKQVYGLAPTEIIYRIATSYIFGFDEDSIVSHDNFKLLDALEYAKEGNLKEKLDELFI